MTQAGIKAILLGKKGTMTNASITNPLAAGLKKMGKIEMGDTDQPVTADGIKLEGKHLITVEAETLQFRLGDLQTMLQVYAVDGGCDAHVVLVDKKSMGTNRAIYLNGPRYMGFGFDYELSSSQRLMKFSLGAKLERSVADVLYDDMIVAQSHPWLDSTVNGLGGAGIKPERVHALDLLQIESPHGTLIAAKDQVIRRSLKLSPKGQVSDETGRLMIDRVTATIEVVVRDASVEKMVSWLRKDRMPSLKWIENVKNDSGTFVQEIHQFNRGTLGLSVNNTRSDETAEIKLTFSGDIPLFNFTFNYDTAYTQMIAG